MNTEIVKSYLRWVENEQKTNDPADVFSAALTLGICELYDTLPEQEADAILEAIICAFYTELKNRSLH